MYSRSLKEKDIIWSESHMPSKTSGACITLTGSYRTSRLTDCQVEGTDGADLYTV